MYLSPIYCKMYLCQTFECICQPKIDMFEVSVLRWWAGRRAAGEPALPSHDQRVLHWYTHLRIHTHLFVTIFPMIIPTIFPIITPTIFPINPPTIISTIFPITILIIDTQTLTTYPHIYHRIANNNSNHYFLLTNFVSSTLNHEVAVSARIPNIRCHLYYILKCPGVLWQLFHFFEKNWAHQNCIKAWKWVLLTFRARSKIRLRLLRQDGTPIISGNRSSCKTRDDALFAENPI